MSPLNFSFFLLVLSSVYYEYRETRHIEVFFSYIGRNQSIKQTLFKEVTPNSEPTNKLVALLINSLQPNISMHILHTVLDTFF